MSVQVIVLAEGQTEETFLRDVVAPALQASDIWLSARLVNHQGGNLRYERVKRGVMNVLKERRNAYISTFFDLYRLNNHFPQFADAALQADKQRRLQVLETSFHADIAASLQFIPQRFFPHIQPYEFEALLFTDISQILGMESGWTHGGRELVSLARDYGGPENINDGYDTKPSARLGVLRSPTYQKTFHGPRGAGAIGLDAILAACPHFAAWYEKLSRLPSLP